jgi:hypothetical protein
MIAILSKWERATIYLLNDDSQYCSSLRSWWKILCTLIIGSSAPSWSPSTRVSASPELLNMFTIYEACLPNSQRKFSLSLVTKGLDFRGSKTRVWVGLQVVGKVKRERTYNTVRVSYWVSISFQMQNMLHVKWADFTKNLLRHKEKCA